jgi:hypothetical protein
MSCTCEPAHLPSNSVRSHRNELLSNETLFVMMHRCTCRPVQWYVFPCLLLWVAPGVARRRGTAVSETTR